MTYLIMCAIFLVFVGYREFFIYKERQMLIDRLMSKDFVEYKKFEDKPEKVEKETKKKHYNFL